MVMWVEPVVHDLPREKRQDCWSSSARTFGASVCLAGGSWACFRACAMEIKAPVPKLRIEADVSWMGKLQASSLTFLEAVLGGRQNAARGTGPGFR